MWEAPNLLLEALALPGGCKVGYTYTQNWIGWKEPAPTNQAGVKSLSTENKELLKFQRKEKKNKRKEKTELKQIKLTKFCTMDYRLRWKYRHSHKSRKESERRYLDMGLNRLGKRDGEGKSRELKYVSNGERTAFSN